MNKAKTSILLKLKPAGTKIILEPNKTELLDLMRLTLFDLVLKQVLILKKKYLRSNSRSPLRECTVVETGKNYNKYRSDKFEDYFISKIDEESYYHLRPYLKIIYNELPENYNYKKDIIKELEVDNLFNNNFIFRVLRKVKLNKKGSEFKNNVTNYLLEIDKIIGDLIEDKPKEALELISFLKGNIFLLKNIKFELFEKIKAISINEKSNDDDFLDDYFWIDLFEDSDSLFLELFSEANDIFDSFFDSGFEDGIDYDFVD